MNLKKSLSLYTIFSFINAGVPFLLLPILTNYLTPEEYGILAIVQIFIILTLPFISISIATTIQLEYHHLQQKDFSILVSSVLIIPIITVIFISIVYVLTTPLFKIVLNIPTIWLIAIPIVAFMQIVPQTVLSIYQISEKPYQYGKYQILLAITNIILTIAFVVLLKSGWEGRVLAILLSYLAFTIIGIFLLIKAEMLSYKIETKYIYQALKLGFPLILHIVSATLFMMSDRLFVSYYIGNEAVGIYAVGAQVAMIALIVQQSFTQAWTPYLFKNLKLNTYENNVKIVKISYISFILFLLLPFIVHIMSIPIFSFVINEKFLKSFQYVFWIAFGYSFLGMYKVVTNYIFYEKRTGVLSLLTFSSLILNFILNYLFIHKFGTIGVAYATALTMGIFFVIVFFVANKIHKMPWLYFIKKGTRC